MASAPPIPLQSPAQQVITAFGGLSATAKALGHRHVSTVHGWQKSGRIPAWREREIKEAADRKGIVLPDVFPASVSAAEAVSCP